MADLCADKLRLQKIRFIE